MFLTFVLQLLAQTGIVLFSDTTRSTGSCTDPQLYHYIPPLDQHQLMHHQMLSAAFCFVSRVRKFYTEIFHWLLLCALEEKCISPPRTTSFCKWPPGLGNDWRNYTSYVGGGCHRFDQSVLNVLLTNSYGYDISKYSYKRDVCMSIERSTLHGIVFVMEKFYANKNNR